MASYSCWIKEDTGYVVDSGYKECITENGVKKGVYVNGKNVIEAAQKYKKENKLKKIVIYDVVDQCIGDFCTHAFKVQQIIS